jgi:hypothetical protein
LVEAIPALLTVEEAGALLRIGRTKAYAMAREWRETDGQSGLPVVDLGNVLRVPRRALEELIGAELTAPNNAVGSGEKDSVRSPNSSTPATKLSTTATRSRRHNPTANQLDLFDDCPIPPKD